jgi:hypothetical protein
VRHSQVRHSDSTHDLSAKVIDNTVSAILKFRDQLDVRAIDRAIELVSRASGSSSTRWAMRAWWRWTASTSSSASAFRPRCMATRTCSALAADCWDRATW